MRRPTGSAAEGCPSASSAPELALEPAGKTRLSPDELLLCLALGLRPPKTTRERTLADGLGTGPVRAVPGCGVHRSISFRLTDLHEWPPAAGSGSEILGPLLRANWRFTLALGADPRIDHLARGPVDLRQLAGVLGLPPVRAAGILHARLLRP